MNPRQAEKILTFLLRTNAVILCCAVLFVLIPISAMESIHKFLGLGDFPIQPITEYLARSTSLLYAVHGFVLLILFWHPRKHWHLLPIMIGLHIGIGACVLGIDLASGMPWYWTLNEGPPIMIFAAVLYWLWKCADKIDDSQSTASVTSESAS